MRKLLSILAFCVFAGAAFAYGGTHWVSSYSRSDGTYVQGHEAGNPGSGIHCHDNVCS